MKFLPGRPKKTKSNASQSNADPEIDLTHPGIVISLTAVDVNASSSIRSSLESFSNVIDESDPHDEKHFAPTTKTDAGRWIDLSPLAENDSRSICDNTDPDSNETHSSDCCDENQNAEIPETEAEIHSRETLSRFESADKRQTTPPTTANRRLQSIPICEFIDPRNREFHLS
jgi:hypothetical protein